MIKDTAEDHRVISPLSFQQKEGALRLKKGNSGQVTVLSPGLQPIVPVGECLFASRKRSKRDFVLVMVLGPCSYSIIHYVAIEGSVQQLEVRYISNACEAALLLRSKKLSSGSLFVELESISEEEYRRLERIARRQLQVIMGSRRRKGCLENPWG